MWLFNHLMLIHVIELHRWNLLLLHRGQWTFLLTLEAIPLYTPNFPASVTMKW